MSERSSGGWLEIVADPGARHEAGAQPLATPEQAAAVEVIVGAGMRFRPWLLHGVTGSGKTEGYPVSYTHLRAHQTVLDLVCRLLLA